MSEMENLANLLFPAENDGAKVLDLKFFAGEEQVTVGEFCKAAHAAFVEVETGLSFKSDGLEENLSPLPVERFLHTS